MAEENFFQKQYFEQITSTLNKQNETLDSLRKEVADIKANMRYIYGWAAGAGAIVTIIIEFARSKLTSH